MAELQLAAADSWYENNSFFSTHKTVNMLASPQRQMLSGACSLLTI